MLTRAVNVLVVDDDDLLRSTVRRVLTSEGCQATAVSNVDEAIQALGAGAGFDVIVTDLQMPGLSGIDLLRLVRQSNLDVPVIVLTGNPSLETAISAVQYGGFRYLQKPTEVLDLPKVVRDASAMHRLAMLKRRALELYETEGWLIGDQAGLESHFEKALDQLWIAFQPIVSWPERSVFGHEALVRSAEPTLNNPALLFEAAERLGRTQELGRKIRAAVTARMGVAPRNGSIFVNLHAADLADEELYSSRALLSGHAGRVVLEVTERSSLERIPDVRGKMARLRRLGFRIAVDDLGAGYAGLASFSQLEPDIAKLDMSLVRGIDSSATKASIVRSMISVCTQELGTQVVCEGVETEAERDTLQALGADLLQGYLFARPAREFRTMSIFPKAVNE
jgi:EAL domain-containing protein (putative c-di-GMP-specific phosphodiesterase class I)